LWHIGPLAVEMVRDFCAVLKDKSCREGTIGAAQAWYKEEIVAEDVDIATLRLRSSKFQ